MSRLERTVGLKTNDPSSPLPECLAASLYDLRGMTGESTVADLRQLMSEAAELRQGGGTARPSRLLATDPTLYSRLCRYAALGRLTPPTIGVFLDRSAAEQWLTAQAKAMEKGGA